jgi:hypothetical protein
MNKAGLISSARLPEMHVFSIKLQDLAPNLSPLIQNSSSILLELANTVRKRSKCQRYTYSLHWSSKTISPRELLLELIFGSKHRLRLETTCNTTINKYIHMRYAMLPQWLFIESLRCDGALKQSWLLYWTWLGAVYCAD